MMPTNLVLEKLCRIAADFRERGNVSPIQLMRESGYKGEPLDPNELQIILEKNAQLAEIWIEESADNRSDVAWYVHSTTKDGRACWVVGIYPETEAKVYFDNKSSAVAYFLVKDLKVLFDISQGKHGLSKNRSN